MKLYIKQKVFSFTDKFTIKDEFGNDRYCAECELFSWGHKLHVFDMSGHEVIYIKQKVWSFRPKFEIYIHGSYVTEIVKEFTFFKQEYSLYGTNWNVQGDFWAHNYYLYDGGRCAATVNKAWFTWGDSYEISIAHNNDELLVVAAVLAIDCAIASSNSNS